MESTRPTTNVIILCINKNKAVEFSTAFFTYIPNNQYYLLDKKDCLFLNKI